MAFVTSLECKFSKIIRTPAKTEVTVRIYALSDGGLDSIDNQQLYNRTLVVSKNYILDAGEFESVVVEKLKNRLIEINAQFGLGFSPGNFICTL